MTRCTYPLSGYYGHPQQQMQAFCQSWARQDKRYLTSSGGRRDRYLSTTECVSPGPSTLNAYRSDCYTSMTTPILFHRLECTPIWFCIRTLSQTVGGGSHLVWSDQFSATLLPLCLWTIYEWLECALQRRGAHTGFVVIINRINVNLLCSYFIQ